MQKSTLILADFSTNSSLARKNAKNGRNRNALIISVLRFLVYSRRNKLNAFTR